MDLDPEWKKEAVEKHLQEEELKVEKNYLLNLCSKNDQIQRVINNWIEDCNTCNS